MHQIRLQVHQQELKRYLAQRCALRACADAQRCAHNAALSALCTFYVPLQGPFCRFSSLCSLTGCPFTPYDEIPCRTPAPQRLSMS